MEAHLCSVLIVSGKSVSRLSQETFCRENSGLEVATRQNIIVVSVAYRLGVFGYMHNKAFLEEDGVMGNFASLDQRAALKWVNENIKSIGGNYSFLLSTTKDLSF